MLDTEEIPALARDLDHSVQTVINASKLSAFEQRKVLELLSKVIMLVEESFQEVYTLLIDIAYLEQKDLRQDRPYELSKKLDKLLGKSYFRNATETCSRLQHIRETFTGDIQATLSAVIPDMAGWTGILGLIEEREGRIITLIGTIVRDLSRFLYNIDKKSLPQVRRIAYGRAQELRLQLAALHDLNGRILGLSGRAGFIELTRNRDQLLREVTIMNDNRKQSVKLGNVSVINSTLTGTQVGFFRDVSNQAAQSSADQGLKQQLNQLCSQVEEMSKHLPPEKQKETAKDLKSFVEEATKETPSKRWYEFSANGLIDAAKTVGAVAAPVINTVQAILKLLPS